MLKLCQTGAPALSLGALLLAAAMSPASATPSPAPAGSISFAQTVGATSFSNTYNFSVGSVSTFSGWADLSFIKGFTATLSGIATPVAVSPPNGQIAFSTISLNPGTYTLTLAGTGFKSASSYSGWYNVSPSVVPEPATAVMALLVVAMLGGLVWRRRSH